MAFLRLLDRVALMATGRAMTSEGMVAGPTVPARRPAIAPMTAMIERVAIQVIRVVVARPGRLVAVFIGVLLRGGMFRCRAQSLAFRVEGQGMVGWCPPQSRARALPSFVLLALPVLEGAGGPRSRGCSRARVPYGTMTPKGRYSGSR
nr:MAG TPA: hypothetical protein [Caudoviricetes sp.]